MSSEIFVTGAYLPHFRPEDRQNPFHGIYRRKLEDTLRLIGDPAGKRILDAGGGMGRLSIPLAGAGADVTLLDLSAAMIREARRRAGSGPMPEAILADAMRLPFAGAVFDLVVALDLFCHLPDPRAGLGELRRVLKPEGRLILDSTNSNPAWVLFYPRYPGLSPRKWVGALRHGGLLPGWEGRVHHYREREFLEHVRGAGFLVDDVLRYGPSICPKWHLATARIDGGGGAS